MNNKIILGNNLVKELSQALKNRLPADWSIEQMRQGPGLSFKRPDAVLEVRGPDGRTARLLVETKNSVEPKDVLELVQKFNAFEKSNKGSYPLLAVRFLTSRTQEKLREAGIGYLDLAGNIWIKVNRPALFIETTGEEKNPWREERTTRTLKGAVAGRIVRALCDCSQPMGVRELALKVKADPGYVSRVVEFLDTEALLTRRPLRSASGSKSESRSRSGSQSLSRSFIDRERESASTRKGAISKVDWLGLIRRWAQDYSPFEKNRAFTFLAPRGISALTENLTKLKTRYAITSSFAASRVAPIAPPRLITLYLDDPSEVASRLELQPSVSGANVMIALPFDEVVYERTWKQDNLTFASLTQVAADLLKSPGRGPEEADALLTYMEKNEKAWRS